MQQPRSNTYELEQKPPFLPFYQLTYIIVRTLQTACYGSVFVVEWLLSLHYSIIMCIFSSVGAATIYHDCICASSQMDTSAREASEFLTDDSVEMSKSRRGSSSRIEFRPFLRFLSDFSDKYKNDVSVFFCSCTCKPAYVTKAISS